MSHIAISIIIPVYNAEQYIEETLKSISEQSFKEYEVILVNDGSTDNSMKIIGTFQDKISNLVVLNQENAGVSAARNNGMKVARGTYIGFVDADDILHKDYLKILYETAKNDADIVFCEYDIFYDSSQICTNSELEYDTEELYHKYKEQTFEHAMRLGYGVALWVKLYKTELIRKYLIEFDEESTFGEDMFFGWKIFLVSSKIYYVKSKLYFYRQALGNATLRFHPNLYESYMREYNNLRKFVAINGLDKNKIERSISSNLLDRIPSFLRMSIRQKGHIIKKYSRIKELVDKNEIQNAIRVHEKSETLSKELKAVKEKKYFRVFLKGCVYEYRFKLARYIKNLIKV